MKPAPKELGKVAGKYAEEARVAVRNVRRDGLDAIKKSKKTSRFPKTNKNAMRTKFRNSRTSASRKIDKVLADKQRHYDGMMF